jgi:hypothetical protein
MIYIRAPTLASEDDTIRPRRQGSMLCSLFSSIVANFREKVGVFLENQLVFFHKLAVLCLKTPIISPNVGQNYLKNITLVPGLRVAIVLNSA